ncbi:MAG TPA: riboflavin synthase [Pseudomonadales bacterium]
MFTGIIAAVGTVARFQKIGGDLRLYIHSGKLDLSDVVLGDSIATNGVCLTVVELPGDGFWADVSQETLARSTLASLKLGQRVNLEKALTPSSRLGGHIVSGHVDGIGEVVDCQDQGRSLFFRIKAPDELARYIAEKGSICVDGVSLTVNAVSGATFDLNIVPHTAQETNIGAWRSGVRVNLEVDIIARQLERLLMGDKAADPDTIGSEKLSKDFLQDHGFL